MFAPWPAITALRVVNGKIGKSPRFRLEHAGGVAQIDMNQLTVFPPPWTPPPARTPPAGTAWT